MNMDMKKEVAKLQKKVSKWTKEWVVMPVVLKNFWDEPPKQFEAYLSGEDDSPSRIEVDNLHFWHFVHYMHAVLNEEKDGLEDFALAARYARATVLFEEAFANAGQGGSILLDTSMFHFALNVLAGWYVEGSIIGRAIYKGLDTSLLDLRHCGEHEAGKVYRHFWFLMHLYCQAKNLELDTSLYSYPEDMNPYEAVLSDWQTKDISKVQNFVSAMADFHIKEARITAHDEIAEFDEEDVMIFPHEILTFLRLREWQGLPNPKTFEHPLMNQPLANMPAVSPLKQPETPLLDRVIEKFKKEYPGSFSDWK